MLDCLPVYRRQQRAPRKSPNPAAANRAVRGLALTSFSAKDCISRTFSSKLVPQGHDRVADSSSPVVCSDSASFSLNMLSFPFEHSNCNVNLLLRLTLHSKIRNTRAKPVIELPDVGNQPIHRDFSETGRRFYALAEVTERRTASPVMRPSAGRTPGDHRRPGTLVLSGSRLSLLKRSKRACMKGLMLFRHSTSVKELRSGK